MSKDLCQLSKVHNPASDCDTATQENPISYGFCHDNQYDTLCLADPGELQLYNTLESYALDSIFWLDCQGFKPILLL